MVISKLSAYFIVGGSKSSASCQLAQATELPTSNKSGLPPNGQHKLGQLSFRFKFERLVACASRQLALLSESNIPWFMAIYRRAKGAANENHILRSIDLRALHFNRCR